VTQHEYVFIAVSIILGLAITRMLHTVAMLIRAHTRVTVHWSTAVWGLSVMTYILQLWWVGWGLRDLILWDFSDFLMLIIGSIFIYGAAEMALPVPPEDNLDFFRHSQRLGRLSALSMLLYFAIGPYVNLVMLNPPVPLGPALVVPLIGMGLTGGMIAFPGSFKILSLLFAGYTMLIVYATA
jgi:hypothetical protein